MPLLWDVIILGVVALCIFLAYRKGLVATLFGLFGTVLALFLAIMLRVPVGEWINDNFVHEPVRNVVLNAISDTTGVEYADALAGTDVAAKIMEMPTSLKVVLTTAGISEEEMISLAASGSEKTEEFKNELIDYIATPISTTISTVIAFVLLFALLSVGMFFLSRLLRSLCRKLPLGKTVDKIGGGLVGLIKGLVIIMVITAVLWVIGLSTETGFFGSETVDKTLLTRFLIEINPICNLFR